MDQHGNKVAQEGCDRCFCGCKYWENDKCVDCGSTIQEVNHFLAGQDLYNPALDAEYEAMEEYYRQVERDRFEDMTVRY